eukprot:2923894-Prymnesium_polylepis.1
MRDDPVLGESLTDLMATLQRRKRAPAGEGGTDDEHGRHRRERAAAVLSERSTSTDAQRGVRGVGRRGSLQPAPSAL